MAANETSFKPGQTGNPNGRPPKGYSITETVREMMSEDPEIKKKLANKILEMALKGDLAAIKTLWGYLEGLPTAKHEIDSSAEVMPIPILCDCGEDNIENTTPT
jgi:hypothetical protein